MPPASSGKWPKILPALTPDQKQISDDFMKLWHEELSSRGRYGLIERFNHSFPVKYSRKEFRTTLEIGAGLGEHLRYEQLSPEQERSYYCNEYRENMAAKIKETFPHVQTVVTDCQKGFDFPDQFFDRIIAIHVLEHLPALPDTIAETYRMINKSTGQLLVVIPAEGSLMYKLARKLSAERLYRKRYGGSYAWFYQREHINLPAEIIEELKAYFTITATRYFPFSFLPFVGLNLCIGLALDPRPDRSSPPSSL